VKHPPRQTCRSSGITFDSHSVVHGDPEFLLASEVALRPSGRRRGRAGTGSDPVRRPPDDRGGAGAPQIVRSQLFDAPRLAAAWTTFQSTFGNMPSPHTRPPLVMARETGPWVISADAVHASTAVFTHVGIGTVRTCPPLPTRSAMIQCSSRCCNDSTVRRSNSRGAGHSR